MNQLENIILKTGFNCNNKTGVVLACLFQHESSITNIAIKHSSFLNTPSIAMKIVNRWKFRRVRYKSSKLVLAVPQLSDTIRNFSQFIDRISFHSYNAKGSHVQNVSVRDQVINVISNAEKKGFIAIPQSNLNFIFRNYSFILSKIPPFLYTKIKRSVPQIRNGSTIYSNNDTGIYNQFKVKDLQEYVALSDLYKELRIFKGSDVFDNKYIGLSGAFEYKTILLYSYNHNAANSTSINYCALNRIIKNKSRINKIAVDNNIKNEVIFTEIRLNKKNILYINFKNNMNERITKEILKQTFTYSSFLKKNLYIQFEQNIKKMHLPLPEISVGENRSFELLNDKIITVKNELAYTDTVSAQLNPSYSISGGRFGFSSSPIINHTFRNNNMSLLSISEFRQFKKTDFNLYMQNSAYTSKSLFENNFKSRDSIKNSQKILKVSRKQMHIMEKCGNEIKKNNDQKTRNNSNNSAAESEMTFTGIFNGFLSAGIQKELPHVNLNSRVQNVKESESNQCNSIGTGANNLDSGNRVTMQRPKGISDTPLELMSQNHIGEIANQVIHIIEEKYHTEARKKGLL